MKNTLSNFLSLAVIVVISVFAILRYKAKVEKEYQDSIRPWPVRAISEAHPLSGGLGSIQFVRLDENGEEVDSRDFPREGIVLLADSWSKEEKGISRRHEYVSEARKARSDGRDSDCVMILTRGSL